MGCPDSDSALRLVLKLGSELGKLRRLNKDVLVKSLKQAAAALSQVEQPSPEEATQRPSSFGELERSVTPLRDSIVSHCLWKHNDNDVRILVAICVSEIFRLLAPEPPFEDRYIRDVFELFLRVFNELDDTESTYFSKRVKILEMVARCKCYLILLDIDCNDLILKMFQIFFSVVREQHPQTLFNDMLSIMENILCEDVSRKLVEVILQMLIKDNKGAISAASRLAVAVIQSCQDKIRPVVCGLLASFSFDKDAEGSNLKTSYHEIVFKIFQYVPEMLLDFVPTIRQELLTDQVDVRIKVVHLIGKLFSLPGNHVAQSQHDLFVDFLKRFSDKSVEVRITALQCAKDCCLVNPFGKESQEIMSAVESRLWDLDDKVRMQALTVACDLATSNLKLVSSRLISVATERLRDKKISVRKKAFEKLMEVYQCYCSQCAKGHMTICDEFEHIPCKILMLCYDKDCKGFRPQNMEIVVAEELFPNSLSIEDRIQHWIHLFSLFCPLQRKALSSILSQKCRLQKEMQHYLSLRKREKGKSSDDTQKRIKSSFVRMSTSFPDPSSAEECFDKLNQMKDNNIFTVLELLLDEVSLISARATRDRLLRIVGDKHPQVEFLSLLSSKCSPNIFASEHVCFILNYIRKSRSADENLVAASSDLLLVITGNFPSLLRGSELQLKVLMEEDLKNGKLIQVLAKAGSKLSVNFSDFYPCLKKLCLEGTRAQSKCAASAISSLLNGSDQLVLAELCEELVDSLIRGRNVPTVLQSLGCIAQYSFLTYEAQDARIESYIYENIVQAESSDDPGLGNSSLTASCKLKIYGLKTIIMSFSRDPGSNVKQKIDKLLDSISQMLQKSEICASSISRCFQGRRQSSPNLCQFKPTWILRKCEDTAHIRLAAAKSILQLSRRWDLHVSPNIFHRTILIAKDPSPSVRRLFLDKVHKLLREHVIPRRYACAFALATADSLKDIQDSAYQYMEEFILEYSKEARSQQPSNMPGEFITEYPLYVVMFLIHVLAHDANFPLDACQDEEIYVQFCWPLLCFLQALVDPVIVSNDVVLVHNAAFYLHYIFRAIQKAEDAVEAKRTPRLHFLAEVGNSGLKLQLNGISSARPPGQILLPSSFYKLSTSKRSSEATSNDHEYFFDQCFIDKIVHRFQSLSVNRTRQIRKRCLLGGTSNIIQVCVPRNQQVETLPKSMKHDFSSVLGKNGPVSANSLGNINSKRHVSKKQKNGSCDDYEAASNKGQYLPCDSVNIRSSLSEEQFSPEKVERSLGSWKENAVASHILAAEHSNDLKRSTKDPSRAKIKMKCDSKEVELLGSDNDSWETVSRTCLTEREVVLADKSNTLHLEHLADTFAARAKKGQRLSAETSSVPEICNLTGDVVSRTRSRKSNTAK